MSPAESRLNKYLALQLGISRREADNLINTGTVTVNGKVAELGGRVTPGDTVVVAETILKPDAVAHSYVAFNKPRGYVCSRRAQGSNETIYALLPKGFHTLKPVGRLDKDSSGLLLLTNDGDFAYQMTHPKFRKTKVYSLRLNKPLEPLHQQMIADIGISLDDGRSQLGLTRLGDDRKEWEVTMSEGRNRQIRRTFSALGYTVTRLHRTQFGPYALGDIKRGAWKIVTIH
ncbi:rRNA pseudouridine synthase [Candidatus Saccharibacteria bacterium]|nr:MAG: rRNA pseudouridine synthase [Candidatus Saccharibacteria bacterium]